MDDTAVWLPELDDDRILATDDAGEELLRFAVQWSGKTIRVRFPRWAKWKRYCELVYGLLTAVSGLMKGVRNRDINAAEMLQTDEKWQELAGRFLMVGKLAKKIEHVFFTYLEPTVDELDPKESQAWIKDNAPLDAVLRMFVALLTPDDMLKKNGTYALQMICQRSQALPSTPSSTSSGGGPKNEQTEPPRSQFGSFY